MLLRNYYYFVPTFTVHALCTHDSQAQTQVNHTPIWRSPGSPHFGVHVAMELAPQLWSLVSYSFPIPLMCYEDPRMLSAQVLYVIAC